MINQFKNSFIKILPVVLITVMLVAGCSSSESDPLELESNVMTGNEHSAEINAEDIPEAAKVEFMDLLNSKELDYINGLAEKGGLVVSVSESTSVYREDQEGLKTGFHYTLVKAFSEHIGVALNVNVVQFEDYFKHNGTVPDGVIEDQNIVYKPDIFETSDLIADNLSPLEWRKKLMSFVNIIPVSIVVMTSDDRIVSEQEDLSGLTAAIEANTSYNHVLKTLSLAENLNIGVVYVENGDVAVQYVLSGYADFTVKDSNAALFTAKNEEQINVSIAISEPEYIGWALPRDDETLKSIVEKYIEYALSSGELDAIWQEEYGVTLVDYSEILGIMDYTR